MEKHSNQLLAHLSRLNLPKHLLEEAEELMNHQTIASLQVPYCYIAALFISSRKLTERPGILSFIKSAEEAEYLLKALKEVPSVEKELREYACSARLYKKLQDLWGQLEIKENQVKQEGSAIKDVAWMMLALSRQVLLGNSLDLLECGELMVGVLHFVLSYLPTSLTLECDNSLEKLLSLTNANEEEACEYSHKVTAMMNQLKAQKVIRSNEPQGMEGVFSACHIYYNLSKLKEHYLNSKVTTMDEVEFLKKKPAKTPVKVQPKSSGRKRLLNKENLKSKRLISWDTQPEFSQNRDPLPSSPLQSAETPMSLAMEINKWLKDVTKNNSLEELPEALSKYSECIFSNINYYKSALAGLFSNEAKKADTVLKLYLAATEAMIKNEEKRANLSSYSSILSNQNFHKATIACSAASVCYLRGLAQITFRSILSKCEVSGFEFWKLINSFAQFDSKFPVPLKRHFRELEVIVLSELAWQESSPVLEYLETFMDSPETFDQDQNNPAFGMFFRRVLSHTAHRVVEICESLEMSEQIREHIWEAVKHALSEHTELLRNRHLDTLILCCIYAVSKLYSPTQFKTLIQQYSSLYTLNTQVYSNIEGAGDIIRFYNHFFIPRIKEMLAGTAPAKPRIAALSPQSPLKANLPSPMQYYSTLGSPGIRSPKSPYMTPRTRKLWASQESPMRSISSKAGRLISFEDEFPLERIPEDSPR